MKKKEPAFADSHVLWFLMDGSGAAEKTSAFSPAFFDIGLTSNDSAAANVCVSVDAEAAIGPLTVDVDVAVNVRVTLNTDVAIAVGPD